MNTIELTTVKNDFETIYFSTFCFKYMEAPKLVGDCIDWVENLKEGDVVTIFGLETLIK